MQPTQLDPDAVNLAKSIRHVESGGNFQSEGKSGEYGAYQFTEPTWNSYAKQYGISTPLKQATPEQQNEVAYKKIKEWKDQGRNVGEIASMWNAGEGRKDAYITGNSGTNSYGASYDTAAYAKNVATIYHQFKGQSTQSNQSVNGLPAAPQQPASVIDESQNANTQSSEDPGIIDQLKAGNYSGAYKDSAKGIGNFLFPIVGDVYHDIKGDNKKTFLEQTGDAGLSILPFIPGLGELGEGARVAKAGIEGVEAVGDVAKVAKTAGLLPSVGKAAIVGYGAGVASNLSQGKSVGESITPGLNNVSGAVLGGAAPILTKATGGLISKIAGINPQIETELAKLGTQAYPEDVELYNKYINATKEHSTNIRSTSPISMAADNLDEAASQIEAKTREAGSIVGQAKKNSINIPLKNIQDIGNNFQEEIGNKYGLHLVSDESGNVKAISQEGSLRNISAADKIKIEDVATQLNKIAKGASVGQAADVIQNINDMVTRSPYNNAYGKSLDPLDGLFSHIAGSLNDVVKSSSPELAAANQNFSILKSLQGELGGMAGKNLNKGELLMRRIFSGDKSGEVQDLFGKIKQATGIDLVKHAVLARHAIESFGSKADKTLLETALENAHSPQTGLVKGLLNIGKNIIKRGPANPENLGRKLISGKGNRAVKSLVTKGLIESSRGLSPTVELFNSKK